MHASRCYILAGLNEQTGLPSQQTGLQAENVAFWYQKTTQKVTSLNLIEKYQDPSKKCLNH
jgi:hypothetical protein